MSGLRVCSLGKGAEEEDRCWLWVAGLPPLGLPAASGVALGKGGLVRISQGQRVRFLNWFKWKPPRGHSSCPWAKGHSSPEPSLPVPPLTVRGAGTC
jgi:hypothetical protein